MTDKLIMTTEQRQELFANEPLSSAAVLMLDSLPMVDSEPVATVKSWTNGSYWRNYKLDWNKDVPEGTKLYTSPQALTQISADDVTDEMVKEIFPTSATSFSRKSGTYKKIARDIANIYNAVLKHRGEAR